MKKIPLRNRKKEIVDYVLVDDDDFKKINQYKWYYLKRKTSSAVISKNKNYKTIYLHRLVMSAKKNEVVDHINHNILDNRKSNLRICTQSQNMMNMRKNKNNTSIYKGVHEMNNIGSRKNKWRVTLMKNYKQIHIGVFDSQIKAAIAYNKAALKYFGEFALLNKI